jgi:hypothetical protein
MTFQLVVEPEADADVAEAYKYYESKQVGLGAHFMASSKKSSMRFETTRTCSQQHIAWCDKRLSGDFPSSFRISSKTIE